MYFPEFLSVRNTEAMYWIARYKILGTRKNGRFPTHEGTTAYIYCRGVNLKFILPFFIYYHKNKCSAIKSNIN